MTINFCEVCLATFICSIITIVIYIASWYKHEETEEEEEFKEADTSNIQGLENEEPIPRGEPNETINFGSNRYSGNVELVSTNEIIKEKSDLCRLHDEDLRTRVAENKPNEPHITDEYVNIERQNSVSEYDPVVHCDSKTGRLHLSIRYDDERSKLIVQVLDAQGLIRPDQVYAPEMCLTFSLIHPDIDDDETIKHTRIFVANAAVSWKEPMGFCITFANAIKHNLLISATNETDPSVPQDREVSIPLGNLGSQAEEINEWFDLELVPLSF